jgi:diguanylate cyclase (GGDEF)-like protein/putative nucleotidyltransferase with HDIG domain
VKLLEMSDYNRAARIYWSVMVVAGTLTGAWGFYQCLAFNVTQWAQFLSLLSLVIVTGCYPIRIPNTTATVTVGDTFTFLSVLFLGVPAAIMLSVVDAFLGSTRATKKLTSRLGAPAIMTVTTFISGSAFYYTLAVYAHLTNATLSTVQLRSDQLLIPLAVMAATHYLLNGLSLATMYALRKHRTFLSFWRDGYLWTGLALVAAACTAAMLYGAITVFGFHYVLLGVPLIAATYATCKVFFQRVNEKTHEADALSQLHLATVEALATAIDAKDQTTHCHVRRVQIYAAGMGKVFGLSQSEIEALKAGALLHDIGKLAVPDHILNKPGRLTSAEFERMKIHTTVGAQILERVNFPYPVVPIVRHHHEQWNGLGYPDGLKGEQIPITARIISVVDCFDSVREDRPYRRGMTRDEAVALLLRGAETHFDPKIVSLFIKNLSRFEEEISELGLDEQGFTNEACESNALIEVDIHQTKERPSVLAYDQIKNAHREVYSLYEIARTFGSSLDLEDTVSILVNKVGHVVPFDTCVVYLYDELKAYATASHVAGKNAVVLRDRCVAPGEGVTGFALANRRAISRIDPKLDFRGVQLDADESEYRSMAALPLMKDERLLGALTVYSMELHEYTDEHMRLLEIVTRLASDALFNSMHHAEAESNAMTDPLTGLPNARSMYLRFEQEAARARRSNQPFQVIMLDLDEFKQVNDTFGHRVGDKMLREIAHIIQGQLREYDFLARYAGDEFVAIVQDLVGEQVVELRERIENAVSKFSLHVRAEHTARVGISVGTATYNIDGETLDQLLIAADQAMYSAKSVHKADRRARLEDKARGVLDLNTGNLTSTAIN